MLKKLSPILLLSLLISCGGADGTAENTDGVAPNDHRIFVTSNSYTGSAVGNFTTADITCTELAKDAGLIRKYKAVISLNDGLNSVAANARLTITGAIYIFSDAESSNLVAASSEDFWAADSKNFLNAVNIDEQYISAVGSRVWTGTSVEGGDLSDDCSDWADNTAGSNGWYGEVDQVGSQWIEGNTASCDNSYRLYCISQVSQ